MTASEKANKAASTLETPCGVRIHRIERAECYADAVLPLQSSLDSRRGVRLTSSFEYPGRYTRWDLGLVDPPLVFTSRGRAACSRAFDRHMPELKPMWRRLCKLAGDGDLESRSLSHWSPPNVFDGCSVAVLNPTDDPVLVRNYDFDPGFTGTEILRSDWSGRTVIGLNEGSWGLLDGMNEDGLVACLTFGGRPVCGTAFSVILVLRHVLETCAPAAQQHALWRVVGSAIAERLCERPIWLNTSGLGVYWVHLRLDSQPKYYTFRPYTKAV